MLKNGLVFFQIYAADNRIQNAPKQVKDNKRPQIQTLDKLDFKKNRRTKVQKSKQHR